jgi:two-component system, chemotaxis family, sensor kinase Cph1
MDFLREIFDPEVFMPHGHCYYWRTSVVLLHVISDVAIMVAYYSIPMILYYFTRKRSDLPYRWMFLMFAVFIFACGTTHLMNVVTVWKPVYWIDGSVKLFTATISIATAILLVPLIPKALALRSPRELERANQKLQNTISELEKTQTELKRSNAELEQFAYVTSHDLQEPIRMISGFSELLAKENQGKLDSDSQAYLNTIHQGSQRIHLLIKDLLEFSLIGKKRIQPVNFDAQKVLREVLSNLEATINETGANISHDTLPTLTGDPSQFNHLLQNLICNSIKFHTKDRKPEIHVGVKEENNSWLFSVKDNGIGIKPEYRERIFQIFQRLHDRETYPGTGIGLSICKKIVEQHHGEIWVDSEFGKGSTFYFRIPKSNSHS